MMSELDDKTFYIRDTNNLSTTEGSPLGKWLRQRKIQSVTIWQAADKYTTSFILQDKEGIRTGVIVMDGDIFQNMNDRQERDFVHLLRGAGK